MFFFSMHSGSDVLGRFSMIFMVKSWGAFRKKTAHQAKELPVEFRELFQHFLGRSWCVTWRRCYGDFMAMFYEFLGYTYDWQSYYIYFKVVGVAYSWPPA